MTLAASASMGKRPRHACTLGALLSVIIIAVEILPARLASPDPPHAARSALLIALIGLPGQRLIPARLPVGTGPRHGPLSAHDAVGLAAPGVAQIAVNVTAWRAASNA